MNEERKVSYELLCAFVDGQLDGAEWAGVAARVEADTALREEVCRLRAIKESVRRSYAMPAAPRARPRGAPRLRWTALAATSVLFGLAGWFGHARWSQPPALDAASAYVLHGDWRSLRGDRAPLQGGKVLVHASSAGRDVLATALDEVEDLLREARASSRPLQVEIVANGPGLDILRADEHGFAERLVALRREYPDLGFVACGQSLQRRRAEGHPVEIVTGAVVAPSALQQVMERLRDGWIYVRL